MSRKPKWILRDFTTTKLKLYDETHERYRLLLASERPKKTIQDDLDEFINFRLRGGKLTNLNN